MEPLIPGLPNDLARECLFRIHYTQLSTLCSVSKAWKSVLLSREFRLHRDQHCNANHLILFKCWNHVVHKLILFDLEANIWSELPPIPEFPNGFPHSFKFVIASFKWGFVVVGGDDPHMQPFTRPFCNKVYVFDYLSVTWQRRADMPAGNITVYECTSDHDRNVYVLFQNCNYRRSECIMVYDVMKDEWSSRIKSKENGLHMIYHCGKIHFYEGGSRTHYGVSSYSRVLNVSTWKWEPSQVAYRNRKSYYVCLNEDGEWYSFRNDGTLSIYKNFTWKVILRIPGLNSFHCVAMRKNKAVFTREVLKQMKLYECRMEACIMDLKNHEVTTMSAPRELRGVFRAECYLEI